MGMMKTHLMKLIVLTLLALPAAAHADPELIREADELFAQRTETTGAHEALQLYEQAVSTQTQVEALWKAARACHWVADNAATKKDKVLFFEKGIALAEKAVALEPKSVEAHFWLGGLYGSYGETKGVLKSLSLVKPIRREMESVNRLNDKFQGGAGYRVLGIVDYKVPGFAGGSKKRALEQLNKALAIDPANAFNHYYAAEFFATAGNDKKKAAEHLDALSKLAPTDDVDAADLKMIQARGERLKAQTGT